MDNNSSIDFNNNVVSYTPQAPVPMKAPNFFNHMSAMPYENSIVNLEVLSLILTNTGAYKNPVIRPYQTTLNSQTFNDFQNKMSQYQNVNISPKMIAGVTNNIITLRPIGEETLPITNGWGSDRFRFILMVRIHSKLGNPRVCYFSGYSDYADQSYSGLIDPEMRFHINSYTIIEEQHITTPNGAGIMPRIVESSNIFRPNEIGSNQIVNYIRPNDVFQVMESSYLQNGSPNNALSVFDTRSNYDQHTKSYRENNYSLSYLTKLINNYTKSARHVGRQSYGDNDRLTLLSGAIDDSEARSLIENPFIKALAKAYSTSYNTVNNFTLNILTQIDPTVASKINYIAPNREAMGMMSANLDSSEWYFQDRTTIAAQSIVTSLSSLMYDLTISSIKLVSTNMVINGRPQTTLIDVKSLLSVDITPFVQEFVDRLENEVMYEMTFMNQDSYQLQLEMDIFSVARISLALGGSQMIPYTLPMFADTNFSPVITRDASLKNNLVDDISAMLDNIEQPTVGARNLNMVI